MIATERHGVRAWPASLVLLALFAQVAAGQISPLPDALITDELPPRRTDQRVPPRNVTQPSPTDPFVDDPTSILDDLPPFDATPDEIVAPSQSPFELPSPTEADRSLQVRPATNPQTPNFNTSGFRAQLARAPYMLGDFFGQGGTETKVAYLYGRAVHHITPLAGAADDFHLIDETGPQVVLQGMMGAVVPGVFFQPSITPPAPTFVSGLTSDIPGSFIAQANGQFTDVYDSLTATSPSLIQAAIYDVSRYYQLVVPSPGAGDIVGRVRLQDNNSALPQDRVFFDYNYFHNVPLVANGIDVNRFTAGIERTIWCGRSSIEVRVPMAMTLNSTFTTDGADTSHFEFGNVAISQKYLLTETRDAALATGMGVLLPTADDFEINTVGGTELLRIENDSFHVVPYLALLYAPQCSDYFGHVFLTYDLAVNGNDVFANLDGFGPQKIGVFRDQHLATVSAALGRWVYRNNSPCSRINGVMWSAELHYTKTLDDADTVTGGNFIVGDPTVDLSLLNGTIGGHVRAGNTTFTAGYTLPITSDDRVFDGEFRFFVNRRY